MSSENAVAPLTPQQLVERRLDDLDRALLGLVPRSERLAIVQQVEAKVRTLGEERVAALPAAAQAAQPAAGERARRVKPRLGMALSAGILGIIAIVLMVLSPIVYGIVALSEGVIEETGQIAVLGVHMGAMALAGLVAVLLGIIALVRLARSGGLWRGHGWAITGLCTGPVPMLIGGLLLMVVMSLAAAQSSSVAISCDPPAGAYVTSVQPYPPPMMPTQIPATSYTAAPACAAPVAYDAAQAPLAASPPTWPVLEDEPELTNTLNSSRNVEAPVAPIAKPEPAVESKLEVPASNPPAAPTTTAAKPEAKAEPAKPSEETKSR